VKGLLDFTDNTLIQWSKRKSTNFAITQIYEELKIIGLAGEKVGGSLLVKKVNKR
jgi:hypothetical protein